MLNIEGDTSRKLITKEIYKDYLTDSLNRKVNFSRISQIITALERDNIVYVISGRKNRILSIEETKDEIKSVLKMEGLYE